MVYCWVCHIATMACSRMRLFEDYSRASLGVESCRMPGASVSVQESWNLEHVAAFCTGVASKSAWFSPLMLGVCRGKVLPFGGCKVVHVNFPAGQGFGRKKRWRHPGTLAPSDKKRKWVWQGWTDPYPVYNPQKDRKVSFHCFCRSVFSYVLWGCYNLHNHYDKFVHFKHHPSTCRMSHLGNGQGLKFPVRPVQHHSVVIPSILTLDPFFKGPTAIFR